MRGVGPTPERHSFVEGSHALEVHEARELLESNLALVRRAVTFACRRYRFTPDDAEEFQSVVYTKLCDDDCAVLRSYEGRSGLSTFLSVVIQRWALDYRIHEWGKWHSSAEAKRLGAAAVELEQHLHRDGRTIEEALPFLAAKHPGVTLDALKNLAASLPPRPPRRHDVPIDDADQVTARDDVEERARTDERGRTAERVQTIIAATIAEYPEDMRLILQLRFEEGLTVAKIARALLRDQKTLYRLIDNCKADLREALVADGLSPGDVLDLIGRDDVFLEVDLGKPGPRPSMNSDERVAAKTEDPE
jgi:RNA polymerase sigma factor (sigma-70 family)